MEGRPPPPLPPPFLPPFLPPLLPSLLPSLLRLGLLLLAATAARAQSDADDWFTRDDLQQLGGTRRGDRSESDFDTDFRRRGRSPNRNSPGGRQHRIRLTGGNSRQGNVEVLIYNWRDFSAGWRSVCDIGWTQEHAEAVCKQLGIPGPAVATKNGRFGYRSSGFTTMVSQCKVGPRGLRDCFQHGVGAAAECRAKNIAGVICGKDPSTPYSGNIRIRLRNRSGNKGDVEVRYGRRRWGPACGDGFDLKAATVVCRQLKLGAAVRSYLSGRRASGPFILAGVECTGRETNLGQCKSIRGASVRCQGNQFSGAAVECTGRRVRSLPDLQIDAKEIEASAFIDNQALGTLSCAMDEKCLADSAFKVREREPQLWRTRRRKLFRFTNKVHNVGGADYRPQTDPGQWQWHSCHSHFHSVESFSEYDLTFPGTSRKVAQGHKASFCLEDTECKTGTSPRYKCQIGSRRERFPQGIKAGCADVYGSYIDCQWIDVTDIESGSYILRVRINADRLVAEQSFDNNQVICSVTLDLEKEETNVTSCRQTSL